MAAAAAATKTQLGLEERVRVPSKRKLEHLNRSNRNDVKTERQGNFGNHKKPKELRGRRKPVERVPDDGGDDDDDDGKPGEASSSEESGEGDGSEADNEVGEGQEEGNSSSGCEDEGSDGGGVQKGVTKFTHGCRAFKMAFTKVVRKSAQTTLPLGPVLSAYKKLVVKKLAEEEEDQKAKGESRKERQLVAERGHVKPASFLDSNEKFLLSVATKGVVKLFNAVNKSQNPQKGLDPSSSRDAKKLAKWKKQAFFSELKKPMTRPSPSIGNNNEEPGWAPLRDSYLLTSSKLKDWDKMENPSSSAGQDIAHSESSSDEE